MTSFTLKIIALIAMFCDHFGYAYIGHFSIFNLIGRIAFPIFAFQISEGFIHTKNLRKYFLRLGVFALISQIPFYLFMNKFFNQTGLYLNIFFTLFLGLLGIYLYDYIVKSFDKSCLNKKNLGKIIGIAIVFLISYIAQILNTDYGALGVILVFMFFLFSKNKILRLCSYTLLVIVKYIFPFIQFNYNYIYLILFFATLLPYVFIDLYNGKQGKKIKYLLYLFYPLHLILLYSLF